MTRFKEIDLLAAARCNMFSHVLVSYITELNQFSQKTTKTFDTISKGLAQRPKYDFCVLKELTQHECDQDDVDNTNVPSFDSDQTLFFASDYADANDEKHNTNIEIAANDASNNIPLIELCKDDNVMDLCIAESADIDSSNENDGIVVNNLFSQVFGKNPSSIISTVLNTQKESTTLNCTNMVSSTVAQNEKIRSTKNSKQNSWIELFSELDPLANLEAFDMKLSGACKSSQQT